MTALLSHPKIRSEQRDRPALIYVRQSTLAQVRHNTASTARQYDLVQRALDLGWANEQIHVIDQDQGHSGASATFRDGFQFLVVEVGLGRAGAVLCLEASRLARSCSDWYRLLELCALTGTLVIDEDGVYDPTQYNDRLLLGFKGTMSEAELHWLRQRLLGGKREKAQQGQLRFRLPTGLLYDPNGQVVLDPDEQVRAAVQLVFDLFDHSGSALAVVQHFAHQGLLFPTRSWGGAKDGELVWQPLRHSRVLALLHNPAYAGAYVYGRTQTRTQALPGEAPRIKGRTRQVAWVDWPVLLQNAHPGYLSWEQFQSNQERLDDNRTFRPEERRGAVREGAALLQGIVLCGRCGRRMSVRYLATGAVPSYVCNELHTQLAAKTCQSLRGDAVDAAVTRLFLEALQPAQLEISLAALDQIEADARKIERQWEMRLERGRYEAELARRRFLAVEPENRLVARTLEKDWNEKLAQLERLEREAATRPRPTARLAGAQERQRILALAQDVPSVWHAESTTPAERKQLLRFLIQDVTLTREETAVGVAIRWQTGAVSALSIPRPKRVWELRRTDRAVVEWVRALAPRQTDRQISEALNREGYSSGTGGPFTPSKVEWIRFAYEISTGCPEEGGAAWREPRGDGRYCARAAAAWLNVTVSTIAAWCQSGQLEGIQAVPHGCWWIHLTPESIAAKRKAIRRSWTRRPPGSILGGPEGPRDPRGQSESPLDGGAV